MTPFLAGVSVLDCSIWRPGPYASSLLVRLGADVLKVEPPGGDPMRQYPELFESVNAGKRSIVLDLKAADDRARAWDLAAEADVLLEGFRPGVMARLGLGPDAVRAHNPRIIYCSISGYGQQDDRAHLPGHDLNYQAWAGALSPEGQSPAMPSLPLADLASGMSAAFGICAALVSRNAGGVGAYLDVAMTDVMSTWTGSATASSREDSGQRGVPGYGLFRTADGRQLALGVVSEAHFWSSLCEELGLDELAGLAFDERTRRGTELNEMVAAAISRRDLDTLVAALRKAAVPVSPVLDRQGMLTAAPFPPFPIRLDPAHTDGADAGAPALDQHRGEGFSS
jgi:crotonobetainyl-CoA:carnitine CoA-transferase CaiB-like acyl-CoA transferase